jgi:hypothetical protein
MNPAQARAKWEGWREITFLGIGNAMRGVVVERLVFSPVALGANTVPRKGLLGPRSAVQMAARLLPGVR